jgi:7-carboxy-7-deazaguanine synthase
MRDTYQVNEIFHSVQGEGMYSGKAATFIRLQGCTVGCSWCDSGPLADSLRETNGKTRNTWWRGGTKMGLMDIAIQVWTHWNACDTAHFVITGGEPTLYDLDALIQILRSYAPEGAMRPFIQLETSGQNVLKGVERPDWVTWSPKVNLEFTAPLALLDLVSEIKFVVDDALNEIVVADVEAFFMQEYRKVPPIILMPEGCPPTPRSMQKCYDWVLDHPNWRIVDRLQYRLGVR